MDQKPDSMFKEENHEKKYSNFNLLRHLTDMSRHIEIVRFKTNIIYKILYKSRMMLTFIFKFLMKNWPFGLGLKKTDTIPMIMQCFSVEN